ncbi:retrovirus-related pol polyprotein from transposon TNT 1-94 [Tanacetum coccineum]|uniref:Retrovirus-related pol polyprotein from transposon TNT 1-94 n=1 Tax=Tanacetum coccineum TaxID=301880 RepID=A0ABQ5EAQ3_9ASTR
MTGDRSQLTNFVHKFLGTVKFGNDQIVKIIGPMRVASINGKNHILVIVDDYSRFTWVKFLASKDEAPDFIIKFLKMIQVRLNATVRNIHTDNETEFFNQTLRSYYESAVATACYTQNRSIIQRHQGKTPYELLHDRKPNLSYLHVFGALCYPNNDSEDLGKLQAKADIGIFIGYAPKKKAYCFEESPKTPHFHDDPLHESLQEDSTSQGSSSNVRPIHTPFESLSRWTKDHPIVNVFGDPSRSISTRKQLQTGAMWCYFDAFLTSVEPKNFKQAMTKPSWIDAM